MLAGLKNLHSSPSRSPTVLPQHLLAWPRGSLLFARQPQRKYTARPTCHTLTQAAHMTACTGSPLYRKQRQPTDAGCRMSVSSPLSRRNGWSVQRETSSNENLESSLQQRRKHLAHNKWRHTLTPEVWHNETNESRGQDLRKRLKLLRVGRGSGSLGCSQLFRIHLCLVLLDLNLFGEGSLMRLVDGNQALL